MNREKAAVPSYSYVWSGNIGDINVTVTWGFYISKASVSSKRYVRKGGVEGSNHSILGFYIE